MQRTRSTSGFSTAATWSFNGWFDKPRRRSQECLASSDVRLANVELGALVQDELVGQSVVGEGPWLGPARRKRLTGHGLQRLLPAGRRPRGSIEAAPALGS